MADTYRLKPTSAKPTGPEPPAKATPEKPPVGGPRPASPPPKPSEPVRRPPAAPPLPPEPERLPIARLTSLDAYRGCIMILLAASGFGIARVAALPADAAVWRRPVATAEGTREPTPDEVAARRDWWRVLGFHFDHPAWRSDFLISRSDDSARESDWRRWGVSAWDLIQPAFMFMVGVSMPFSYRRRTIDGQTPRGRMAHALFRSLLLVLLGVFLATKPGSPTVWVFTNVLAQIGLGYFFVYLLLGRRWWLQGVAVGAILLGYWGAVQYVDWRPLAGADPAQPYDYAAAQADVAKGEVLTGRFAPWSKNGNLAHAVDVRLLNLLADPDSQAMNAWRERLQQGPLGFAGWCQMTLRRCLFSNPERFTANRGGYQTLNFIPSLATMLLGVMCGGVLIGSAGAGRKFFTLLLMAIVCLALGRLLGIYLCPIVKRIWTPSWALFSGGYVIALLALFYLLFDILPFRRLAAPLTIVGMNSLAMYLMGQLLGPFLREKVLRPHLTGLLETLFRADAVLDGSFYWLHPQMFGPIIEATVTLLLFWLIVFWMWRRKVFVRL